MRTTFGGVGPGQDEYLFLQPTRVVPRKRIELSIQLARWLEMPSMILFRMGPATRAWSIRSISCGLPRRWVSGCCFEADRFAPDRGLTAGGEKIYGPWPMPTTGQSGHLPVGRRRLRQRVFGSDLL